MLSANVAPTTTTLTPSGTCITVAFPTADANAVLLYVNASVSSNNAIALRTISVFSYNGGGGSTCTTGLMFQGSFSVQEFVLTPTAVIGNTQYTLIIQRVDAGGGRMKWIDNTTVSTAATVAVLGYYD